MSTKHFIWTDSEHTPRGGHTVRTVTVYRVIKNKPVFVGKSSGIFQNPAQLVMRVIHERKALPRTALLDANGHQHYPHTFPASVAVFTHI